MRRFEELGFEIESRGATTCTMIDQEADYAHDGALPDDIIWFGNHYAGDSYPGELLACDGNELKEWSVDEQNRYSLYFSEETGDVRQEDIAAVKEFILFRNSVIAILNSFEAATKGQLC